MVGENRALRPFWMHQIVEYIIGIVFISAGIQSPTPAIPATLGLLVMLNAAITEGPAGAFRWTHRRVHRILDLVLIGLVILTVVQPFIEVDSSVRVLAALLAVVLAFVWWNTDFATKPERKARRRTMARPSSEEVGRQAGRTVADGIKAGRRLKDRFTSSDD